MAGSRRGQAIPTQLGLGLFEQFVLPHLSIGRRGPAPKLGLFKIFNYILQLLYLGCQWKELPIERDNDGCPEIHYTRNWLRVLVGVDGDVLNVRYAIREWCTARLRMGYFVPCRTVLGIERTSRSTARPRQTEIQSLPTDQLLQ